MKSSFRAYYESSPYSVDELTRNIKDIEDQMQDPCPIRIKQYGGRDKYMSMLRSKLNSYKNMLKTS